MTARAKGKRAPLPVIQVDHCMVRIIGEIPDSAKLPKRQSFAWPDNARAYAEQLSLSRGWPIERARG